MIVVHCENTQFIASKPLNIQYFCTFFQKLLNNNKY